MANQPSKSAKPVVSKPTESVQFNYSEEKWGLYKPLSATMNGVQSDDLKTALVQMFILEPSSKKAFDMAVAILSVEPDPNDSYTVRAGKANGLVVEIPVTGTQLIRRCKAVIELNAAGIKPEVITAGTGKSGQPAAAKNPAAGFAKKAPAKA